MINQNVLTMFMMIYHQSIISTITAIIKIIYIIPIYYFGLRIYNIKSFNSQNLILSNVKWSTKLDENNKPIGYFIGNNMIGFYNLEEHKLFCICTENYYKQITKRPSINKENDDTKSKLKQEDQYINIYNKNNRVDFVHYRSRMFNITNFNVFPNQEKPIEQILHQYNTNKNKSIVCMIYGKPNTGKSMISILLAKKLNGSYCKSYKPIDPGDSIDTIYDTSTPKVDNPLIILLDEFDIMLNKIHNKNITSNKKVLTEVSDKISWNQLFDNINIGFYPYTIIIMTSNENPDKIKKMYDSSYIRENRCHLFIEMK